MILHELRSDKIVTIIPFSVEELPGGDVEKKIRIVNSNISKACLNFALFIKH
jgi:hypothetical protein